MSLRPAAIAVASLLVVLCGAATRVDGDGEAVAVWSGAEVSHLLTPSLAETLRLKPAPEFAVFEDGTVVVITESGDLFDLTSRRPLPASQPLGVQSLAALGPSLVAVHQDRLGWYERGQIVPRLKLPSSSLRLAAGPRAQLYLYGPHDAGSVVYRLDDAGLTTLVGIPSGRISALTVAGQRVFFSVGNVVYGVAPGERPAVVFATHGDGDVRSLAADAEAGFLYLAAGETVYAMRGGVAFSIVRGVEGSLRSTNRGLYVLDAGRRRVLKISGLERLVRDGGPPATADGFKE